VWAFADGEGPFGVHVTTARPTNPAIERGRCHATGSVR
jgi:hypothetical protein